MYSQQVRHFLMHPINGPQGVNYCVAGGSNTTIRCRTNPTRVVTNRVKFMLCVDNGVIMACRWEAFGDPVAIATASWCVQQLKGASVFTATSLYSPEKAALALNLTDPLDIRAGCMTVLAAVTDALCKYKPPVR